MSEGQGRDDIMRGYTHNGGEASAAFILW